MAPQADFSKIGYEIEKFFGRQKSYGNGNPPATQNLCIHKFYPTSVAKVVHMHVEDVKCNEAASIFIAENRTELRMKETSFGNHDTWDSRSPKAC
ncbi:unnamed protein product [Sphenostylis stenocarpa]|uniref:Uncharacterized protein n=1 Tax=Sphenostylis stenocarpa TaxID=92480 RepID=A0AA86VGY8_9FABA|nr:unnamed protein product [Sphenostylis stenocarpa]